MYRKCFQNILSFTQNEKSLLHSFVEVTHNNFS